MRRIQLRRFLLAALGAVLLVAIIPTDTLTRLIERLSADADNASRFRVTVGLRYEDSRRFEFTMPLSEDDASRASISPGAIKDRAVTAAKRALARKLGYSESVYGDQSYRIMGNVTVASVTVVDQRSGQTTEIYKSDHRGADGYAE